MPKHDGDQPVFVHSRAMCSGWPPFSSMHFLWRTFCTRKFHRPLADFDPRVLREAQDHHRPQGSHQGEREPFPGLYAGTSSTTSCCAPRNARSWMVAISSTCSRVHKYRLVAFIFYHYIRKIKKELCLSFHLIWRVTSEMTRIGSWCLSFVGITPGRFR